MSATLSIRRRLLLWLLVPLLGISGLVTVATYVIERAAIEHHQDQRLRHIAIGIPPTLKRADLRSINVKLFHERDDFLLQIWDGNRELYRSTVDVGLPNFGVAGFSEQAAQGERWKIYLRHSGPYAIQVAQSLAERSALARERAYHLVAPLCLLLLVIAAVTPLAVTAGLKALTRISRELDSRHLDRLVPLDPAGEPAEILPVVEAINTLLERLSAAAQAQQRFLADASHELRTPLAGLQLQVQLLEQAADEAARRDVMAALKASIRRTGHLVDQLLTTSRLDADAVTGAWETVSLNEVVREGLLRLEPLAGAKRIDVGLVRDDPASIRGSGEEVLLLVLNLIDNAIRYTPEGGRADVSIVAAPGSVDLVVEDSGPGIAQPERARAFDRFFRGTGHAINGTGLGLAIVKRIADRHHATVTLGDSASLGGLAVVAAFPPLVG